MMKKKQRRPSPYKYYIACSIALLCFSIPFKTVAQDNNYEEISVTVNVQGVGGVELPALIEDDKVLLPVLDILNFLKIKTVVSSHNFDSVSGFFITQDANYLIDRPHNTIFFKDKTYTLKPGDLVATETNLYLKLEYFDKIFQLSGKFNFRALFVDFSTTLELPLIREKRLELMRMNVNRLRGEIRVDSNYKQKYAFAHFGTLDWSLISTQRMEGPADTRVSLGGGAILAGGEFIGRLNYAVGIPLVERDQYYMWRHVNNNAAIKQVMVGKIATQTVASIFAPIVGFQVSNAPTTTRKSYGSYILKNFTKPGWIVELYVNNVLVDFKRADSSGFYSFEVPMVYGNSLVRLRFYGPYGEESFKDESITIPFYFLPKHQVEYSFSGGYVQDDSNSKFSRGVVSYGLSKHVTLSTGVEYLTSIITGATIPFAGGSIRLGQSFLLSGEYDQGVRAKGQLSYRFLSSLQFDAQYTRYVEGQKAILNSAIEERKLVMSVPIHASKLSLYSLLTFNQTIFSATRYNTVEWLLAGVFMGLNVHISNYGVFVDKTDPYVYASISTALRLTKGLLFTPEVQYDYTHSQLISTKGLIEKTVFKRGYVGFSAEQNFKSNFSNYTIQFRYDLSFAQLGFASQVSNNNIAFQQSAKGSIIYDRKSHYLDINNGVSVGRGGVVLRPFLDLNCDGVWDADEPKVSGLKLNMNGGHIQPESKDTTIRILDMEPYSKYYIELSRFSFDNIAWQIKKRVISITIVPNMFREIVVPIAVVAEVNGTVYRVKNNVQKGIGQVYVCVYKGDSLVAKTLSEPDGYFSYIGLPPGDYTVKIDSEQMQRINMNASSAVSIHVDKTKDGDVVEGLEFTIKSNVPEVSEAPAKQDEPVVPPVKKKTKKSGAKTAGKKQTNSSKKSSAEPAKSNKKK